MRTELSGNNVGIAVKVLFFGGARDAAGADEVAIVLQAPATASQALAQILENHPDLSRFGTSLLMAVNQEYAPMDCELHEGDEVALFPPVSGGSGSKPSTVQDLSLDFFEITTRPIDVGMVARRVVQPQCGATVILDGYAREWTSGRRTLYLVYDSYKPMALRELQRLGRLAHEQFAIAHIGIVHRTGRVEIGETSVVVVVSAPHRRAAFQACEWAIRQLKQTVPIWKKEVFEDGEVWVEGEKGE